MNSDNADIFRKHHDPQLCKSSGYSFSTMRVLEFLNGLPWDDLALTYVMALNPTRIRVTTGYITLDAVPNRITVYLEKDDVTISDIEMEISVMTSPLIQNGSELSYKLRMAREKLKAREL